MKTPPIASPEEWKAAREKPLVREMGSTWDYLDITALGRQEDWEDSPEGYSQSPPFAWANYHDAYGDAA